MIYKMMKLFMTQMLNYLLYYHRIVIALVSTLVTIVVGIALFFYSPEDSSFFYYREDGLVANPFGLVGAHCASILIYLFGGSSFFILFFLIFLIYQFAWQKPWMLEVDRLTVFPFLMLFSCALMYGHGTDPLYATCPGGYCGLLTWGFFARFFDPIAAFIVLYGLVVSAFIVCVQFPFAATIHYSKIIGQFLYAKRYMVMPVVRVIFFLIRVVIAPFLLTYNYLYRLFTGSTIAKNNETVVSLEHEDENGFAGVVDDEFWKSYRNGDESEIDSSSIGTDAVDNNENEIGSAIQQEMPHQSMPNKEKRSGTSYRLPQSTLFNDQHDAQEDAQVMSELELRAQILEEKLERFGVCGKVTEIKRGPVVTLFEYQPHIDTKLSKIIALEDDLAMALQALSIRIIAPIPGRSVVGFEVANATRKKVIFGSIIKSKAFRLYSGSLPLVLGCDTTGNDVIVDLAKMPHLLIAGSTGSGKSVALNSMLVSLLCQRTPQELRLVLIDPKRLEFAPYADISHLLFPIVTNPKQSIPVLKWVVKEMEDRYEQMKILSARNVFDYNKAAQREGLETLPFIVIIIDELSDLMITAGREIEDLIVRITQMARAAGIYMLVATQRPSVDVITGLIKVNFPSRISFRVTSKVDSRTILDCAGAEKLLGRGDMLFLDAGASILKRVHGAYVSDIEIEQLVSYIRSQCEPSYCELPEEPTSGVDLLESDSKLYKDVIVFLEGLDEISISLLQRRFRIGYNRSARIIDMLESEGIIAPSDGGKMRKVVHR